MTGETTKVTEKTATKRKSTVQEAPVDNTQDQQPPQASDHQDTTAQHECAQAIIEKYSKWSFGVGLIPLPMVDLVALTGVQLKMVSEIAKVYGQSFKDNKVKSVITSLLGGAMPQALMTGGASSTVKSIPFYGTLVGMATMPMISAAATYAIGATFNNHFLSGGTLLNLDMSSMKARFDQTFKSKVKKTETATETETA